MMTSAKIVIVEDEPAILLLLDTILTRAGYDTLLTTTGRDAYPLIQQIRPDLVILDLTLEQPRAGEMVLELLERDPHTSAIPVLLCSGDLARLRETAARFQPNVQAALAKPFQIAEVLAAVRSTLAPARSRERGA